MSHSNKDFGNLWTNPPPAHNNVESFMNEQHGNSLYYKVITLDCSILKFININYLDTKSGVQQTRSWDYW